MLEPLSKQKQALIVNSVKRVFEKNDIGELTKTAYNYLYLCSGFIAHYNHGGFMCAYSDVWTLAKDIINHNDMNMWRNFGPNDKDFHYMMSKADVYRALVLAARKYLNTAIVNA